MTAQNDTLTARGHEQDDGLLEVEFLNHKTNDRTVFAVEPHLTLQQVWDMAYIALGETRADGDVLEKLHGGHPLTEHLDESIKHVAEHVNPSLEFQIHGEQGGA
jgi:hypothetical protein